MPFPLKSRRGLLCAVLSLALLGASVASADTGSSSTPSSSSSSKTCACSDVRPRSGGTSFELGPTCAKIQAKGNCNEGYMQKTIAEMKGAPYCQVGGEREREIFFLFFDFLSTSFRPRLSHFFSSPSLKT